MSKSDFIETEATVLTALPNALFKVKLDDTGTEIIAHISGKIRKNSINIIPGDKVTVAISPYDMTKCRIIFRIKKEGGGK
jgi:translation initiation factor IF-1